MIQNIETIYRILNMHSNFPNSNLSLCEDYLSVATHYLECVTSRVDRKQSWLIPSMIRSNQQPTILLVFYSKPSCIFCIKSGSSIKPIIIITEHLRCSSFEINILDCLFVCLFKCQYGGIDMTFRHDLLLLRQGRTSVFTAVGTSVKLIRAAYKSSL